MPIPEDFVTESLYDPDAWFVHDLTEVGEGLIRGVTDTTQLGPIVGAQRERPGHPKHVPGAVMIQITATLGQLHAMYGLGLRANDGWVGFGTHLKSAKFPNMGRIGPPMTVQATATRARRIRGTMFIEYDFLYEQEGAPIYVSTQTAAWFQPKS